MTRPGLTQATDYYARQVILPEIGPAGQARLHQSRVLVIGAGGLGSPILMALAGAGIGHLTLVDHDTVSASNLNRQFLYTVADIGRPKAVAARERLLAYHPDLDIVAHERLLTADFARQLVPDQDLVVAAVDHRLTRRLINRICYELGKPWIDGGVRGFSGSVATYIPGQNACLDCRFDWPADLAPPEELPEATLQPLSVAIPVGTLGATASVIGSLEADLALCLLLGLPDPLQGQILYYHGRTLDFAKISIAARPGCPVCSQSQPPAVTV